MKDVIGFEGRYAVTKDGRVWSYPSKAKWKKHQRGHFLAIRDSGHHIRYGKRVKRMYKRVSLSKDGKNKDFYLHRLVALAFLPNPNGYKEINHKNGDGSDNRVENLEWCNRRQNLDHAILIGRTTRGKKNMQCKLNEESVRKIRVLVGKGKTQREVANMYNITQGNVSSICRGRNWGWLN